MDHETVLVVAAHPDDEVLGCGAAMARHAAEGDPCHVLILAEGATSRDDARDPGARAPELAALREQARKAADILGSRGLEMAGLPDNRMDTVPLLDVVKIVEGAISRVRPTVIYTHFGGDLNVDHRITARAVETATRPLAGNIVKAVYTFEILSSTEWNFSDAFPAFRPNHFVNVEGFVDKKIAALECYQSETNAFPHPRSREAVNALAALRGSQSGLRAAEAFRVVRQIR